MLLHYVTLIIGIISSQYNYDNLQYTIIWEENIRFSNEYNIYMSSRNYETIAKYEFDLDLFIIF